MEGKVMYISAIYIFVVVWNIVTVYCHFIKYRMYLAVYFICKYFDSDTLFFYFARWPSATYSLAFVSKQSDNTTPGLATAEDNQRNVRIGGEKIFSYVRNILKENTSHSSTVLKKKNTS